MIQNLTLRQLEDRLDWVENIIASETDPKNLPYHNSMYQRILDELARRDVATEERHDSQRSNAKSG